MEASHKASSVHRVDLSEVAPVMLPVPSLPPLSRRWFPGASASQWKTLIQMVAVLGAALAVALFLFWQTVAAMAHTWVHDRSYSQGFIVPIIAIFLAWTRRQNLVGKRPQPWVAGLFLLAGLGFVWVVGNVGHVLVVQEFALIGIIVALVWTIAGTTVTRELVFPLGFLFFAVPFGSELLPTLQDFTAKFAAAALHISGMAVVLDEHVLSTASGTWQVAEACSGLRYLTASLMIGVLLAGLIYRSWKRRLAFVTLSIVVPIVANGIRAYGIVLLGSLSTKRTAATVDHVVYGTIFFSLISVGLIMVGFRWREHPVQGPILVSSNPELTHDPVVLPKMISAAVAAIVILGTAPLGAALLWTRHAPDSAMRVSVDPKWHPAAVLDWDWTPLLEGAATEDMQSYVGPDTSSVQVYTASYRRGERSIVLVNSYNIVRDATRWQVLKEENRSVLLHGRRVQVRQLTLQSPVDSRVAWMWYDVGGEIVSRPLLLKELETRNRLLAKPQPVAVIAVSASYDSEPAQAEATLTNFAAGATFLQERR